MRELKQILGFIGGHKCLINLWPNHHRAHRLGAVGHLFGDIHDVRSDAEGFGPGQGTAATEGGDHFVKNQQDIVLSADLADALQITDRWHNHPGGTGERLNNHRGDG
ncbi:hypothetical protein D3C72_2158790 [compost metagenome]